MPNPNSHLAAGVLAGALLSLVGAALSAPSSRGAAGDAADLLRDPARQPLPRGAAARVAPGATAAAVGVDDVYDVDSFGRSLRWLGSAQMNLALDRNCDPVPPAPGTTVGSACAELGPLTESSEFAFEDVARIRLPRNASHSLLCHWVSPLNTVQYRNEDPANPVVGRFWYQPTLTIENPVLNEPGAIDPGTGQPYGGRLTVGLSNYEYTELALPPATGLLQRDRDTAACIGGFVSRAALVNSHGLTEQQARRFFRQPTTIRLNLEGGTRHVESASLIVGLRVVGD